MKRCINCNIPLNDSQKVCHNCGAQQPPTPAQKKKHDNTAAVAVICVAVVIVAVIAAVAGIKISENNNSLPETVTVTVTVTLKPETTSTTASVTATEKETTAAQGNVYNYYYNTDGTPSGPENPNRYENFDLNYYSDWDYLYPSDTQLLTTEFLDSCSKDEVDLIRNEIYARHGYIFKKEKYRNYFLTKAWYEPTESNMDKVAKKFNKTENKNIAILVDYQNL